ncbi:MAG: hypothetical protein LBR21_05205 [Propionibacteriaceae bacterium]|jgi:signal transduction histidine kinase|nr:hypothetical protein [Propionibacteriaceae bacterium]
MARVYKAMFIVRVVCAALLVIENIAELDFGFDLWIAVLALGLSIYGYINSRDDRTWTWIARTLLVIHVLVGAMVYIANPESAVSPSYFMVTVMALGGSLLPLQWIALVASDLLVAVGFVLEPSRPNDLHTYAQVFSVLVFSVAGFYVGRRMVSIISQNQHQWGRFVKIREQRSLAEERLRATSRMHDTVSKEVMGSLMLSQELDAKLQDTPYAEESAQLVAGLEKAQFESRQLLLDLRGRVDPSLEEGFEQGFARLKRQYPFEIEVDTDPESMAYLSDFELQIVRVVSELVENVHRHAHATKVVIVMKREFGGAYISVSDNGIGMQGVDLEKKWEDGHFGIRGIQEAVWARGGRFEVKTGPDGTTIEIHFQVLRGAFN